MPKYILGGMRMDRVMRDRKAVFLFLFPSFILYTLIVIVPIFMSAFYSLNEWNGIGDQIFVGLNNYIRLFGDKQFLNATGNTLMIVVTSVFIQLPISLLLSLVLASKVKGERFFVTVYFIPVILSAVVIGQLWMRIYNLRYGLLNLLLNAIGLTELGKTAWLGNMGTVLISVLVPILWQYIGYHMLLFYSGIKSISPDIYEAAKIDGASFWKTSFSITIPLLKPIILVSLTFAVTGSMKVYDLVRVMTADGGPGRASDVMSTLLVRTMIYPGDSYGYGSSMAVVLITVCFTLYFLLARLFREKDETIKLTHRRFGWLRKN
jgi:raffinose/stachyose/melibiose transport system permease protein